MRSRVHLTSGLLVKMFALFLVSIAAIPYSHAGGSIHCDVNLLQLTSEIPEPDLFTREVAEHPLQNYQSLESAQAEAMAQGRRSFPFHEQRPTLLRIMSDLNHRLERDSVLELPQFHGQYIELSRLRAELLQLFVDNLPYDRVIGFIITWAEAMDALLRGADPKLSGTYHRDIAGAELVHLRDASSHSYIFFSFESVDEKYFWKIRPAPIYLLGILPIPRFTVNRYTYLGGPLVPTGKVQLHIDGYLIDLEEFLKHDAGHSAFMRRRDLWLFKTAGETRAELVRQWQNNRDQILLQQATLANTRPDLAAAAGLILTEVIHERGYQYYLPILRQQLSTTKWIDVIRKKLQQRYWSHPPLTVEQAALLEPARQWLLGIVEHMMIDTLLEATGRLRARRETVTFKEWLPIETFRGHPLAIHVAPFSAAAEQASRITVTFDVAGQSIITSIYEVSLAQIRVGEPAITDPVALEFLRLQRAAPEQERLTNTELFKIEQIFTLMARIGGETEFTITREPVTRRGMVHDIDLKKGIVEFQTSEGVFQLPLGVVSLQSL